MSEVVEPPLLSDLGGKLFQNRRWVHPTCVITAIALGGARLEGRVAGAALLIAMIVIRLWAARFLGGASHVGERKARQKRVLVTGGPFAWVRNPLYIANSLGLAGACLQFGPPWLAALAFATSLLWYRAVIGWEEKILAGLYGREYADYASRVPRLLPRPPHAVAGPARELYPWGKVVRRERGAMFAAVALIALSLLLDLVVPLSWHRDAF